MSNGDDLDIDLGIFWRALAQSWVLIVVLVVVGGVAGGLITAFTGRAYDATAAVYLGQPTDALGNDLAGLQNNPTAAASLATSESVITEAAEKAGEPWTPQALRRALEIEIPSQVGKSSTQPINTIIVHVIDDTSVPAARAANAVAGVLVERLGGYADQKIALLQSRVEDTTGEIAALDKRASAAERALEAIAASDADAAEKAAVGAPYISILQSVAQMRSSLAIELQEAQVALLVAEDIERPSVINRAIPPRQTTGSDWRLGVGVGMLAGAVVGIIAAVIRRRRAPQEPQSD